MPKTEEQHQNIETADQFVNRVLSPEYVMNLMHSVGYELRSGIFHPAMTVWLMMYQRICGKTTLAETVGAFRNGAGGALMERCDRSATDVSLCTGGLSQARTRLPEEAVHAMADTINEAIIRSQSGHLWHGRSAYVLDGTDFRVLAEGDIRKEYPPSRDSKRTSPWSTIRSVIATHVVTGVAVGAATGPMYGRKAVGEVGLSQEVIADLPANSIMVADRGLGTFFVAFSTAQRGHDVLVRLTEVRAKQALEGKLPKSDSDVPCVWKPAKHTQQTYSISGEQELHGRLIRHTVYKNGARPTVLFLFTTLNFPLEEIISLYALRWNVETDFRTLKTSMKMELLNVRTAAMARKEIALGICAYNIVRHILAYAAHKANVPPRSISFTRYAILVKYVGLNILTAKDDAAREQALLTLTTRLHQTALPKRRKPRTYRPRKVLRQPEPYQRWTTRTRKMAKLAK